MIAWQGWNWGQVLQTLKAPADFPPWALSALPGLWLPREKESTLSPVDRELRVTADSGGTSG